ncbi:hypothetical protein [Plebeiibacterium sediminum]|uniref:Uncharacterized protein n=1 Tax=Plebeiibacterium sediminum TaxID=2992112 RepID=A0AAE3M8H6_9BACT|nr:hypothetical protein [Plebeiobacterium sediminum]MCW3788515.1 hypothetical protein [Plebeiobacterium sediminum]
MNEFTKETLDQLLHKEVIVELGDEDDVFTFKGKLISYNTENESSEKLTDFCIYTDHGAVKTFTFNNLRDIKLLEH